MSPDYYRDALALMAQRLRRDGFTSTADAVESASTTLTEET